MPRDTRSIKERLTDARTLEKQEPQDAIKEYKAIISSDPLNSDAYNRLMILYRKQNDYKSELATIQQAIKSFEKEVAESQREWKANHKKSVSLSRKLAKALGLITEKGLPIYENPQVHLWRKREVTVRKRLA